jgi:hypothetical protein
VNRIDSGAFFQKAEFLLNEIKLQDYSSREFEANADNIRIDRIFID